MGTVAEKLNYLNTTKNEIKNVLKNKGIVVNDTDTFRSYSTKIKNSLVPVTDVSDKDEVIEAAERKANEIIGEVIMSNV